MPFINTIEFNKVGFSYPGNQTAVLRDLSLNIRRGDRIGVMGPTGSGKSTLMDLLLGLLLPSEGQVKVDGVEIGASNVAGWQARVAHVPQNIYLSDSSIAENIALGVPLENIDIVRVKNAARQAALDDFIAELTDGYETFVGERGIRISGGQRQRIGIARALYHRADVLVLDEATSALDVVTENEVMDAVNELNSDLTVFLIAHRITTLKSCDKILRLPDGEILSYDQVLE